MRILLTVALVLSLASATHAQVNGLANLFSKKGGGQTSVVQDAPSLGSGATGPLSNQLAPESSTAAFAPTSHEAIQFALSMYRGVRPEHTFVDIGCGDGRVLIAAVQKWGCRGVGYERDPAQAALARACIEAAGLSDKIDVVEKDVTDLYLIKGDAAFAYLYPETLERISHLLERIPAVVSYQHDIPGLGLKETQSEHGKFYSKEPVVQAETRVVASAPYADWGGRRYFAEYNRNCNCAMCQSIRGQLRIPRTTTVTVQPEQQASAAPQINVSPQRTGRMVKQCINGVCQWVWVWDE